MTVNDVDDKMKTLISRTWDEIISKYANGALTMSSEKTLVFQFAWHLANSKKINVEKIDFEVQLFDESFSGGKFLDLMFEGDTGLKIGIEFKFPKKGKNGYSNQTDTRVKIINDIKRVLYLKQNNKIDLGVFLMLTDEAAYTNKGKKKEHLDYATHRGKVYKKDDPMPHGAQKSKQPIKATCDIKFQWMLRPTSSCNRGINEGGPGKHGNPGFWSLTPVFI